MEVRHVRVVICLLDVWIDMIDLLISSNAIQRLKV